MQPEPYTIVVNYHTNPDLLKYNIERCLTFIPSPTSILILNNGCNIKPIFNDNRIKFIDFLHTKNIGYMMNCAYDYITTDYFIHISATTILKEDYIINSFNVYNDHTKFTGMMIKIKSLDYLPEVVYNPSTYENLTRENAIIDYTPETVYLDHKKNYLWYNEIFNGYGFEDVDYHYRWVLSQRYVVRTTKLIFYRYIVERNGDFYEQNNNNEIFKKLIHYYFTTKTIPIFNRDYRYFNPT